MATVDQQTQNKTAVKYDSEEPQRELINKHRSISGCNPSLRNPRREDLEHDRDWAEVSLLLGLSGSDSKLHSSSSSAWLSSALAGLGGTTRNPLHFHWQTRTQFIFSSVARAGGCSWSLGHSRICTDVWKLGMVSMGWFVRQTVPVHGCDSGPENTFLQERLRLC